MSFIQKVEAFLQDEWLCLSYSGAMKRNEVVSGDLPAILIIDDNNPTLELYAGALRQDYRVFTCSNQHDARAILAREAVQLVVLEPTAAGYQGWELLKEILRAYAIPVIICSVLEDRRVGLEAGASAYLIKPVLPTTLAETLKGITGSAK